MDRIQFIGLAAASLMAVYGCGKSDFDSRAMKEHAEQLKETSSFRYPLDKYFPEIPVTVTDLPNGESYHTGEDSFAPPGTPVYAIGNGIKRYSGKMGGYGWLIIIDHPSEIIGETESMREWKRMIQKREDIVIG
jgi:murein DD-endopeptidase MepM/ murein hydrolase activator NlpD